ncbi:MAG TPA: hypothetical protein VFB35_03545 [Gaiellaceae bacterium]|nr:hypothetical protein [Gaiellaceae bacterium]
MSFALRGLCLAIVLAAAALLLVGSSAARSGGSGVNVACDSTELTTAFTAANTAGTGALKLAANCVYTLSAALPTVTGDIAVVGAKYTTIMRDPATADLRFFDVAAAASLRVESLTLLNGASTGLGGAIQTAGNLTVQKVDFARNSASNGGAISVSAGGSATVSNSTFTANTTTGVGGGALINFGTLVLKNSDLTANTAPINGGALNTQPSGTTTVSGGRVTLNTSGSLGGAVANLGTTSLQGVRIESNQGSAGGAIATANANVSIAGGTMGGNIPDNCSPQNTIPKCVN